MLRVSFLCCAFVYFSPVLAGAAPARPQTNNQSVDARVQPAFPI
jgi:hypothetical protein